MPDTIWLIILLTSGGVLCTQDWRTCSVGLFPLLIFSIACVHQYLLCYEHSLLLFYILTILGVGVKIFTKKNAIGVADYFVSIAIAPFLRNQDIPFFLIIVGLYGIFATLLKKSIRKNSTIPFVSVLLLSVLTLRLYKGF